jgi:anti-sigma28 factor (negative regulator of flagellin synthesis)
MAGRSDQAAILSAHPETVKSYVQMLKNMHPADLHRVEELRERIRSGEYQADPDEMAEHIARQLIQERHGNRGA